MSERTNRLDAKHKLVVSLIVVIPFIALIGVAALIFRLFLPTLLPDLLAGLGLSLMFVAIKVYPRLVIEVGYIIDAIWQDDDVSSIAPTDAQSKLPNPAPAMPPAAAPTSKREPAEPQPWESIPDNGWDRLAVELLWKEYSDSEIADRVGKGIVPKTVTNRMSDLRGQYPNFVPTREKLKQMSRGKLS